MPSFYESLLDYDDYISDWNTLMTNQNKIYRKFYQLGCYRELSELFIRRSLYEKKRPIFTTSIIESTKALGPILKERLEIAHQLDRCHTCAELDKWLVQTRFYPPMNL